MVKKGIRWNPLDHDKLKKDISKIQTNEIRLSGKYFDERNKIR
jgi:hypothetical protein